MLLLSEFYLHRFRLQVLLPMDTHTSSRRALKLAQRLRNKGARKQRERRRARQAAQTASERQATSQWKSIRELGAETPEERETRNGSSTIHHFERGDEDLTG